jgi:glucoamylase
MPLDARERYAEQKATTDLALWRFDHQAESFPAGRRLRLELLAPAVVRFSTDGWRTAHDLHTRESGIGFHFVDLPSDKMEPGARLAFTFRWPEASDRWEGANFTLLVKRGASPSHKAKRLQTSETRPDRHLEKVER